MILLSLLAATTATHFGGGNPNDLAKAISDATGQSVVIYQARPKKYEPFDFDTASLDGFARTLRAKADLIMAPGVDYIFYDGFLPDNKVPARYQGGQPSQASNVSIPADALKDGKYSFATKGAEALPMASLTSTKFTKTVNIAPFFSDMAVYVQAKGMPELDLLNWTARAVGARVSVLRDQYKIVVDGSDIRTRAIRNIDARLKRASKDDSERTRDQLLVGALNAATPSEIANLLTTQADELKLPLTSGSSLGSLAIARINSVEKARNDAGNATPSLLQRLDPRTPSYAVITPGLEVFLDLAVRGGGRGGSSRVRM